MAYSILVTGGAGYVGSHAVDTLLAAGHRVVVLDNLEQGHRAAVPEGAELVVGDLADRELVASLVEGKDAVMHFAALSLVGDSMREPFRYLRTNVGNGLSLIEAAAQAGVRRFVLSSTANVYGRPGDGPLVEDSPLDPGSPYGESKRMLEQALVWSARLHGMAFAVLRYFNAAGAHPNGHLGEDHRPETHLIPLVLDVALGKRSHIEVYGTDYPTPDGTCIRDYIHVVDLADAHRRVLDLPEGESRLYNVGTGQGHSVNEIIEAARRVTGHPIPVKIGPRRPGDPAALVAAADRLRAELGWTPRYTSIEETIRTAWVWRQKNPDGYGPDIAVAAQ